MPKTSKARRVTLRPSTIVAPTPDILASLGLGIIGATENERTLYGNPAFGFDHEAFNAYLPERAAPNYTLAIDSVPVAIFAAPLADNPPDLRPIDPATLLSGSEPEPAPEPEPTPEPEPVTITPAHPAIVAATDAAAPSAIDERASARAAAAVAVARFYSGKSLPFKAAADLPRKSPVNFALARNPSERTAALIAAILTYCDVQPGTLQFRRGSGTVRGVLLGYTGEQANRTFSAGPESGCLSNNLDIANPSNARLAYVSGALAGPDAANAVFALNYAQCRSNLLSFNTKQADGEHLYSGALALLDILASTPAATNA